MDTHAIHAYTGCGRSIFNVEKSYCISTVFPFKGLAGMKPNLFINVFFVTPKFIRNIPSLFRLELLSLFPSFSFMVNTYIPCFSLFSGL